VNFIIEQQASGDEYIASIMDETWMHMNAHRQTMSNELDLKMKYPILMCWLTIYMFDDLCWINSLKDAIHNKIYAWTKYFYHHS